MSRPDPQTAGPATRRGGYFDWARAGAGMAGEAVSDVVRPGRGAVYGGGQRPQPGVGMSRPEPPPEPGPATRPGGYLDQAANAVRNWRPNRPITGGSLPPEAEPPPEAYDESLEPTPWLAYAAGGAIPDDREGPYPNWRAEEAGYTTSSADPRTVAATAATPTPSAAAPEQSQPAEAGPVEQARTQAEPPQSQVDIRQARQAAAPAIQIGKQGLSRIFGIGGGGQQQGGIATPEDEAAQDAGIRRFASGEGAATKQELAAIDHSFGFDQIKADEGTKNLMRLDATVRWHLERGDKERAEAVAASILLSGATQVQRAGVMAQTAFQRYQKTGDPQDLRNASLAVQKAHQIIPDGMNMKIDIDPKTRQIVATMVGADGKSTQQVVDPATIPQLLQSAMDGSAYWSAMEQVGQPEMALQDARNRNAAAEKVGDRAYNEDWEQRKHERNREDVLATEDRAAARDLWKHQLETNEGRTEDERTERAMDSYFADWGERMKAAPEEDRQALTEEGLGYRYDNTRDRKEALSDEDIAGAVKAEIKNGGLLYDEDAEAVLEIARGIGLKNPGLDEAGAASAAYAMVTSPEPIRPNTNGTMYVEGADLVFNPMLLPKLGALRKKYKQ